MMNQEISKFKSQKAIKQTEYLFIAKVKGHDVLFVKAAGINPTAYKLPNSFLNRLKKEVQPKILFEMGKIYITPCAIDALNESNQNGNDFLKRHQAGDWGIVDKRDENENEISVTQGFRILSAYMTNKGEKLWIITEADRSSTTILLPSEY